LLQDLALAENVGTVVVECMYVVVVQGVVLVESMVDRMDVVGV